VPIGTVRSRIFEARRSLRALLVEFLPGEYQS